MSWCKQSPLEVVKFGPVVQILCFCGFDISKLRPHESAFPCILLIAVWQSLDLRILALLHQACHDCQTLYEQYCVEITSWVLVS